MARTATGIDVGTSTVTLIRGEVKDSSFVVTHFAIADNDGRTVESGWKALDPGVKPTRCRVGLTGRDVNIRYTRVPRVPDWQLRKLMRFEAQEVGGASDAAVASDFNVLPEIPEIEGEDVVILCMAREAILAEHMRGLSSIGGKLDAFTPNAIGLYNAFLHYGVVMEDTVLVADIGAQNIDVIIVRGTDLLFARNLAGGSRLFDDALAQRFQISPGRAETYKLEKGTLRSDGGFDDPNQEKAARAMAGPAGQLLSLLQSTVLFCKSQVKLSTLKVDRVFLCGGGAALEGLTEYLSRAMSVPVEIFDPFIVVDTSKLDAASAELLEENRMEAVTALGLATSGSDPDAYGIEILPESVRRRRDFVGGPAFLIAAAVLAVVFLGLYVVKKGDELEVVKTDHAALNRRYQSAKRTDQETRNLLAENELLAGYADELFTLAGSGEQLVRALGVIEKELPEGFWLDSMSSTWSFDDDLGIDKTTERPILRIRGKAREGTDTPALLFEEFVRAVQTGMPAARISDRWGTDGGEFFTLDLTLLAPPEPPDEAADEAPEGEEG